MSLVRMYDRKEITGVASDGVSVADLDDALDYYDGYADRDRIVLENALIKRYATRVRKGDADATGNTMDTYEAADVKDAIQKGRQELILSRFYRRVVNVAANLFTEPTQRYSYIDEDGNSVEDVEEAVRAYRADGGYNRAMIRGDRLSVALGSSVLYVYYQGGLRYQAIAPQCVTPLYAPEIFDGEDSRLSDSTNPDEAVGWVLDLGASPDDSKARVFVAYIGASDHYPMGRCVRFTADSPDAIPEPGSPGAYDHMTASGEIANPLTAVRLSVDSDISDSIPEYPLVVLLGSDAGADSTLLPTTGLSLFRDALELDMAWSRLAMTSLKSARGVYILNDEMFSPLPTNPDEGIVLLRKGQTLQTAGVSSVNSKDAAEVIKGIQSAIAESWNVPAHEVITGATVPESGVALFIRSQPKIKYRKERAMLNEDAVNDIFAIERALLYAVDGNEEIPWSVRQVWSAGEYQVPISDKERVETLKAALDAGLIDRVEFVRAYHRLATTDEAAALIRQMVERSADLPAMPTQQQPGSARAAAIQRIRGAV